MEQLQLFATTAETDPAEETARRLIRPYVRRGESAHDLMEGGLGSFSTAFRASIGGRMNETLYGHDKIIVEKDIDGNEVNKVFQFRTIYAAVKAEG
jgi:hypothetical protein